MGTKTHRGLARMKDPIPIHDYLPVHTNQDIKRRQNKDKESTVTGAKEIQQLNPDGPDNRRSIWPQPFYSKMISSKAGPITELEARPFSMQPKRKAKLPFMTG